ncbi:MAG TPA: radical SAM protein [Gemmatimonadaceae bacterium]
MDQLALFEQSGARHLPLLDVQKDIRYYAAASRSVLNGPSATGMDFWSINPYVGCAFGCAYCYARYAHRYTIERLGEAAPGAAGEAVEEPLPPWLAFERRILVKREAPNVLRRQLASATRVDDIRSQGVVIGTATDPYQPAERRFRLTRGVLEVLAEQSKLHVTIITKSPLVTRDVDLLVRIAARSSLSVHVSLITVDRELARRLEPRAPTPEARLRAIARLRAYDLDVAVNVMPVLPGITDAPPMIEELVGAVARANVSRLGACALRLRRTARDRYLPFIDAEFPQLSSRYRRAYGRSHQVCERYRDGLRERFAEVCARHGVAFSRYYRSEDDEVEEPAPASVAAQRTLWGS